MTKRTEVIKFAKFNHLSARSMAGSVLLHKTHGADYRNDFSRWFDNWKEAHAYLLAEINAVKDGASVSYPWEAERC